MLYLCSLSLCDYGKAVRQAAEDVGKAWQEWGLLLLQVLINISVRPGRVVVKLWSEPPGVGWQTQQSLQWRCLQHSGRATLGHCPYADGSTVSLKDRDDSYPFPLEFPGSEIPRVWGLLSSYRISVSYLVAVTLPFPIISCLYLVFVFFLI